MACSAGKKSVQVKSPYSITLHLPDFYSAELHEQGVPETPLVKRDPMTPLSFKMTHKHPSIHTQSVSKITLQVSRLVSAAAAAVWLEGRQPPGPPTPAQQVIGLEQPPPPPHATSAHRSCSNASGNFHSFSQAWPARIRGGWGAKPYRHGLTAARETPAALPAGVGGCTEWRADGARDGATSPCHPWLFASSVACGWGHSSPPTASLCCPSPWLLTCWRGQGRMGSTACHLQRLSSCWTRGCT